MTDLMMMILFLTICIGLPLAIYFVYNLLEKKKERRKEESDKKERIRNAEFMRSQYHEFKEKIKEIADLSTNLIEFPENQKTYIFNSLKNGVMEREKRNPLLLFYPSVLITESKIAIITAKTNFTVDKTQIANVKITPDGVSFKTKDNRKIQIGLFPECVVKLEFLMNMYQYPFTCHIEIDYDYFDNPQQYPFLEYKVIF